MNTTSMAKKMIGEVSPATALRERLKTSRTDNVTCQCGAVFEGVIWLRDDDTEILPRCPTCRQVEYQELQKAEWESELKELIKNTRAEWEIEVYIPARFKNASFDNFDKRLQLKAYKAMLSVSSINSSAILFSPGIFGVGKTHLCCALANEIIKTRPAARLYENGPSRLNCPVAYRTENGLVSELRDTFRKNSESRESDVYRVLNHYDFLIIDDVGKVRPSDTNYLQNVWFEIVDSRYCEKKSLIIATNLNLDELENHIGGACADRLREMCGKENIIKMVGKSYRQRG